MGYHGRTDRRSDACSVGAAIRVLIRAGAVQFENPGFTVMNLTCSGQNLTYACVFFSTSASYTVYHTSITFGESPQGAWTATLVFPHWDVHGPAGDGERAGGGPRTCAELPVARRRLSSITVRR